MSMFCILYVPGHIIDVQTGEWVGEMSGLGAGLDSFYEYLLKVLLFIHTVVVIVNMTFCRLTYQVQLIH